MTSPGRLLVGGYLALVLAGTALLSLPVAVAEPPSLTFTEALFTATSAVCVTGLTVVGTGTRLSLFGQIVVMTLIQIGGLGVMTLSTLFAVLAGRRISLRGRLLVQEELHQNYLAGLVRLVRMIAGVTLLFEGIGAGLLFLAWVKDLDPLRAAYFAIFHAISGFNNAGFDLWGTSLTGFLDRPLVVLTIAGLLVVGGIGFSVIADLSSWRPDRRVTLHSRVALSMAGLLMVVGFVFIAAVEWGNPATLGPLPWHQKILAAFFSALTPRTAGFNVVPTEALRPATLFFLLFLMFIGVSPGSTGGGIKTTTAAVVGAAVGAALGGRDELVIFERRLPRGVAARAIALAVVASMWVAAVTMAIMLLERFDPLAILFEVVSAFGTVGLSTGITPHLSTPSRLLIVVTMLVGKVGPVTFAMALAQRFQAAGVHLRYPEERISLG
ncbi:MAG: TrkH family potassium uptake protein [Bacillota bacterium]